MERREEVGEGGRGGGRGGGKGGGKGGGREKCEHVPLTMSTCTPAYHIDSVYMFSLLEFLTTNPPSFACVNRKRAFMKSG